MKAGMAAFQTYCRLAPIRMPGCQRSAAFAFRKVQHLVTPDEQAKMVEALKIAHEKKDRAPFTEITGAVCKRIWGNP